MRPTSGPLDVPRSPGKRRLVLVVQRYGADIVGGAEAHARMIAERLAASGWFAVEVWTTTSRDFRTWDDSFPAGLSEENGVAVRRFSTERPRSPFFRCANLLLRARRRWKGRLSAWLEEGLERFWYRAQGPYCPTLLRALEAPDLGDVRFLFFTYLYYPTALGLPLVGDRASLVPTAHDEAALYTRTSQRLFRAARHLLVNSPAEKRLLETLDSKLAAKIRIAGVGMDDRPVPPVLGGSKDPLYGLYLGRIGRAKNLDQLLAAYRTLRATGRANWQLWLAGRLDGDVDLEGLDGVRYLGFLGESEKEALIDAARFIINPSEHESLSLLVLEAVAAQKPLVLNRRCAIFRDYARLMPTVLLYENADELAAATGELLATDWQAAEPAARLDAARARLGEHYSWPKVLAQYRQALE